jgi:hypothetical protein
LAVQVGCDKCKWKEASRLKPHHFLGSLESIGARLLCWTVPKQNRQLPSTQIREWLRARTQYAPKKFSPLMVHPLISFLEPIGSNSPWLLHSSLPEIGRSYPMTARTHGHASGQETNLAPCEKSLGEECAYCIVFRWSYAGITARQTLVHIKRNLMLCGA